MKSVISRQRDFKRAWEAYCAKLPQGSVIPTFSQICYTKEVQAITNRPSCEVIPPEHFRFVVNDFKQIHLSILREGLDCLRRILPATRPPEIYPAALCEVSLPNLATTIFRCRLCGASMHTRQALIHFCSADNLISEHPDRISTPAELRIHWLEFGSIPIISAGLMQFDGAASHIAELIVKKSIPNRTSNLVTCEDLDASTSRFTCTKCRYSRRNAICMEWRDAVSKQHSSPPTCLLTST
jgi:hypothetical protein